MPTDADSVDGAVVPPLIRPCQRRGRTPLACGGVSSNRQNSHLTNVDGARLDTTRWTQGQDAAFSSEGALHGGKLPRQCPGSWTRRLVAMGSSSRDIVVVAEVKCRGVTASSYPKDGKHDDLPGPIPVDSRNTCQAGPTIFSERDQPFRAPAFMVPGLSTLTPRTPSSYPF